MPASEQEGLRSPKILPDFPCEASPPADTLNTPTPEFEYDGGNPLERDHDREARSEAHGNRVGWDGEVVTVPSCDLSARLRECILGGAGTTHVFGIGNPLRQDDAVGLEVVSSLRRRIGPGSRKVVKIHGLSSNPERLISDLASRGERIVLIDAVEAKQEPGTIVCTRLSETKFGFFATHNIPLRLVPGVAENAADTYVVGIQPESVLVREGLSDVVKESSEKLVAMIARLVEETE